MPNWVTNRVVAKDFDKLQEALINKETGEVDFNILKPHSKDLDIIAGSIEYASRLDIMPNESALTFNKDVLNPYLHKMYSKRIKQDSFACKVFKDLPDKLRAQIIQVYNIPDIEENKWLDGIFRGYFNTQRYGYKNWYEANTTEWGTKWNATETCILNNEIRFRTAWSTPFGVWKALSKLTDITVAFADEDTGYNCGLVKFSNGIPIGEFGQGEKALNFSESKRRLIRVGFALAIEDDTVEDFLEAYEDEDIKECFNTNRVEARAIIGKSFAETKEALVTSGFTM